MTGGEGRGKGQAGRSDDPLDDLLLLLDGGGDRVDGNGGKESAACVEEEPALWSLSVSLSLTHLHGVAIGLGEPQVGCWGYLGV